MKTEVRIKATQLGKRVRVSMEVGFTEVVSVGIGDNLAEAIAGCLAVGSADVADEWRRVEDEREDRSKVKQLAEAHGLDHCELDIEERELERGDG